MFQNIYENIKISLGFSSNIISKDLDIISNSLLNNSEQLYLFYFICFSILPLVGFSITLNNLTKANNFFQALFLTIFIIVTLLFIATFFSFYWQLKGTIILVGYILLSYNCFIFIKKSIINFWNTNLSLSQYFSQEQIKTTSYSIICRIPDLIILIFPFYFLLVMSELGMYGYDTFWHGMFSKHINAYGGFWNTESIILQSHMTTQPFFYLLQNLFLSKDIFDERVAVFANNFFVSIALLSLTTELKDNIQLKYFVTISLIVMYSMFGHGAFMTLTVEHCLAITLAFFLYFLSKDKINKQLLFIIIFCLCFTVTMKENFIFLIPFISLFSALVLQETLNIKNLLSFKKINIYILIIPSFIGLAIYLFYQSSFNVESVTRTPFDFFAESERLVFIPETASRVLSAMMFKNIITQGDLNSYFATFNSYSPSSSWLGSALFILLLINLYLLLFINHKKIKIFIFSLNLGMVFYFLFLLSVFVFGMNQNRSMALASYERYVSVFIFGTMILTMFITINLDVLKSTNNYNFSKYKKYLFLLVLIIFYFYNGLYSTRMFVTMNPDVNFVKIEKFNVKPLRESVFKLHESKDKKNIVAIFQENRANIKWIILKYMLSPHHDVLEIKFKEDHDDVKRKLLSSDILVYDQIDSNKMKFIASFFHQFNLSQPKVNACYIIKNNHEINCIN